MTRWIPRMLGIGSGFFFVMGEQSCHAGDAAGAGVFVATGTFLLLSCWLCLAMTPRSAR